MFGYIMPRILSRIHPNLLPLPMAAKMGCLVLLACNILPVRARAESLGCLFFACHNSVYLGLQ